MCKACDISISDMIKFLSDDREHMKQGLFLDVQQSYLLHSTIGFDEVALFCNVVTYLCFKLIIEV